MSDAPKKPSVPPSPKTPPAAKGASMPSDSGQSPAPDKREKGSFLKKFFGSKEKKEEAQSVAKPALSPVAVATPKPSAPIPFQPGQQVPPASPESPLRVKFRKMMRTAGFPARVPAPAPAPKPVAVPAPATKDDPAKVPFLTALFKGGAKTEAEPLPPMPTPIPRSAVPKIVAPEAKASTAKSGLIRKETLSNTGLIPPVPKPATPVPAKPKTTAELPKESIQAKKSESIAKPPAVVSVPPSVPVIPPAPVSKPGPVPEPPKAKETSVEPKAGKGTGFLENFKVKDVSSPVSATAKPPEPAKPAAAPAKDEKKTVPLLVEEKKAETPEKKSSKGFLGGFKALFSGAGKKEQKESGNDLSKAVEEGGKKPEGKAGKGTGFLENFKVKDVTTTPAVSAPKAEEAKEPVVPAPLKDKPADPPVRRSVVTTVIPKAPVPEAKPEVSVKPVEPPAAKSPAPVAPPSPPVEGKASSSFLQNFKVKDISAPEARKSAPASPGPAKPEEKKLSTAAALPAMPDLTAPWEKTTLAPASAPAVPPATEGAKDRKKPKVVLPPPVEGDDRRNWRALVPILLWGGLALLLVFAGVSIYLSTRETQVQVQINAGDIKLDEKAYVVLNFAGKQNSLKRSFFERRGPIDERLADVRSDLVAARGDYAGRLERKRLLEDARDQYVREIPQYIQQANKQLQDFWSNEGKALQTEYDTTKKKLQKEIDDRAAELKIPYQKNTEVDEVEVNANAFRLALYQSPKDVKVDEQRKWVEGLLNQWKAFAKDWQERQTQLRDKAYAIKESPGPKVEAAQAQIASLEGEIGAVDQDLGILGDEIQRAEEREKEILNTLEELRAPFLTELLGVPKQFLQTAFPISPDGSVAMRDLQNRTDMPEGNYTLLVQGVKDGKTYWAVREFSVKQYGKTNMTIDPGDFVLVQTLLD